MDSTFPAALLLGNLALLLGFAHRATAATLASLAAIIVAVIAGLADRIFAPAMTVAACWGAIFAISLLIWFRPVIRVPILTAIIVAVSLVAGTAIQQSPSPYALLVMLTLLLFVPARLSVKHRVTIAPRICASWISAVALLSAALPLTVAHPGFVADHRE